MSTTLRDLYGTWVVGFNLGVEVALIETITPPYGKKKIMRIKGEIFGIWSCTRS